MKNPVATITSAVLAIFLLGAGSLLFVAKKDNNDLFRDLTEARSKTDSLAKTSESLNKDLKIVTVKNDSLASKNGELEKSLSLTHTQLAARERDISKTHKTIEETNKKYNDLLSAQRTWEKESGDLKEANQKLGHENESLKNKIVLLADDNKKLNEQLVTAKTAAKDNILIETMTKSGQLNIKGRRVRKIVASFNVQNEMKSPTFRIYDPSGVPLPEQNGSFDLKSLNEPSANSASGGSMKIEVTYLLSKKIGSGLYRIEILNENKHVGNLLVRFR